MRDSRNVSIAAEHQSAYSTHSVVPSGGARDNHRLQGGSQRVQRYSVLEADKGCLILQRELCSYW